MIAALRAWHRYIKSARRVKLLEYRIANDRCRVREAADVISRSKGQAFALDMDFHLQTNAAQQLWPLMIVAPAREEFCEKMRASIKYSQFPMVAPPYFRLTTCFAAGEFNSDADRLIEILKPALMDKLSHLVSKSVAAWMGESKKYSLQIPKEWGNG